ncbi:ABC transporter permease [Patulibacter defluvii]|uniref:ABC transporter permease n=1 Tax=Patulibacter defluvii TaxID=3095358 RepID=UPI002A759CFB|nr:ABC transporter permease [Patulibacter sp. DM4]
MSSGPIAVPAAPRRARRRPPFPVLLAIVVLAVVLVCALLGAAVAPHDPAAQDLLAGVQGPGGDHLLGTDDSGRDVLSRVIAGARGAVLGPAAIVLGAALLGALLGLVAGYRGGWRDAVIMRLSDAVYALPSLVVVLVVVGVVGGGQLAAVAILILFVGPFDARLVRGVTLEQRGRPYVDAARTLGLSSWRIMLRHVWPNVMPIVVANAFLNFAYALVALSALSFLGIGVDPGTADWGRMLSENLSLIEDNPAAALAPGIALVLLAVAMNLLGDWLYEQLSDRGRAR